MNELEKLEHGIMLKYQMLSMLNEEIAEMEKKRHAMIKWELEAKRVMEMLGEI